MRTKWVFAFLLCIALGLSSCAAPTPAATPLPTSLPTATSAPVITVQLEYIGHSSTLITTSDGTRILSDPYGNSRPYGLAEFPANIIADVITVSHFHPDHSGITGITGPQGMPHILQTPEAYQAGPVKISGFSSDHGVVGGKAQGDNTVFVFEIGNVKIVHLGGAGLISQPDILAALNGANSVVADFAGDEAHPIKEMLQQLSGLNIGAIIPGHFCYDKTVPYYGSVTLDDFLALVPASLPVVKQESTLEISPDMPKEILVLNASANIIP